jgi:uncharacterized protein (DUF1015 family)
MFDESDDKAIFIYQIRQEGKTYKGIINNTHIQDLMDGKILFHEDTIADKEQDMVQSSLETRAMVKPVLLFHQHSEKLDRFISTFILENEPCYNVELNNNITNTFWKINDEKKLLKIQELFETEIEHAYIADGHHRCSSTLRLYKHKNEHLKDFHFEALLTAYFSVHDMEVYDHIKVVSILDTLKPEVFMAKLSKYAEIRHIKKFKRPSHKHEFVFMMNGEIYKASWKKSILRKFEKKGQLLDVFMMNEIVFQNILEIEDVRKDSRISYFSGYLNDEVIIEKATQKPNTICILQYPLDIKSIMATADKKINLPPKSTWFEPKIKSGVIAQKY